MPFTTAKPDAFKNQDKPITEVMELLKKVVPGYNDRTVRRLIMSRDRETFWVQVAVCCGPYESYSNSHFYLVEKEVAKAVIADRLVQATIEYGARAANILEVSTRGREVFFEWSRQRQKEEEWKKESEKTFKDAGGIPHSAETFD